MLKHKYIMIKFDSWRTVKEELDQPITAADTPAASPPTQSQISPSQPKKGGLIKPKPWKAGKEEIVNFWKGVPTNTPLALKPIAYDHKGTTIQEDGLRITGSKEFISSVLSRLKDFLIYENPDTKLMVSYRQSPKSFITGNRNSFSFYLQVKSRGKK